MKKFLRIFIPCVILAALICACVFVPTVLKIVLVTLKIIGIVLLVALGLALLLLAAVLFVPVRYRLRGNSPGGEITVKATWMLFVLCFDCVKNAAGFEQHVKIFGVATDREKAPDGGKKKKEKNSGKNEAAAHPDEPETSGSAEPETLASAEPEISTQASAEPEEYGTPITVDEAAETGNAETSNADFSEDDFSDFDFSEEDFSNGSSSEKRSFGDKIEAFAEKIKNFIGKFERFLELYSQYRDCLGEALTAIKKGAATVLPRRSDLKLEFGFDDPSLTGYALAAGCAVRPLVERKNNILDLTPDFENKKFSADGWAKGRVRVICVLGPITAVLIKKKSRDAIRDFKEFADTL